MQGSNVWLDVGLREGKNREVRKILEHMGLTVNRLIRVSYGPFQLLDLPAGAIDPVQRRVLIEQIGPAVARDLGFEDAEEKRAGHGAGRAGQAKRTGGWRP